MSDVVVTVPKALWATWLDEGDLATVPPDPPGLWGGIYEYGFTMGGTVPDIQRGDRVYVVAHGRVRGYSLLDHIDRDTPERFGGRPGGFALVRHGGAVAVTIPDPVRGFQGFRYRWWNRADEVPFPDWQLPDGQGVLL